MRNYGLAILGLVFAVSCSEEDPRIDISYTGAQLRSVKMPVGGVETGHLLINGDGSIRAFNLSGTPDSDGQESSMTFFSLYAAEEAADAVIRTMGRGLLNDSAEDVKNFEAASGFNEAVFHNAFPLVQVDLLDDEVPLQVTLSAWSPFIPRDIRNSNLPVAVFEWELTNPGKKPVSYSLALAMQNPPGLGGQSGHFSLDELTITPNTVSGWKGFTFSNGEGDSSISGTGAVSAISFAENTLYVPLIGGRQKALEQFWTDFSTDGKLELQDDISMITISQESQGNEVSPLGRAESGADFASSSCRMETDSDPFSSSGRMKSRSDKASSSYRLESRNDIARYSGEDHGMAALCSSGVLEPGESVTIPFLFAWHTPFGHTIERLKADAKENEAKHLASSLKSIDDITGYMVSEYENLRDKTMQFSHAMITSTIAPEALETVLSGFADAVEQRDGNSGIIRSPFPGKETIGTSATDLSAWNIYHATSGFAYDEEERIMKFSPTIDVLPVRFFWATQSGWGTINVSRARIVLDCIYGSLDLQQLLLEGRSFFVFREFVPSREANTTYDNETLIINFPEKVHIPEGMSFTMEIP